MNIASTDETSPEPSPEIPLNGSKIRRPYSHDHVGSAQLFAHMSAQIENKYKTEGHISKREARLHSSLVINSVISSAAFMEARINELFADAADKEAYVFPSKSSETRRILDTSLPNVTVWDLPDDTVSLLANLWKLEIPRTARYPILHKYQIALTLAHKKPFNTGMQPYQHADWLVKLRNELVHSEPEWVPSDASETFALGGQRKYLKFEKMLAGTFPINPMANSQEPFFPSKCLGSGCAKWAVASSTEFVDEFLRLMGFKAGFYDNCRVFPLDFTFHLSEPATS